MEKRIGATLEELFEDLKDIHETLNTGVSMLAVIQKAAESPEMADALDFLVSYLRGAVEDVGILTRFGQCQAAEASQS